MLKPATFLLLATMCLSATAETATVSVPETQNQFITVLIDYASQYESAPNPLKKSALVKKRAAALEALNGGNPGKVENWVGVLEEMDTTSDGDAYISVVPVTKGITLSTWNNSFSDGNDKTLIKSGSPLYEQLSELQEGNVIKFSGNLIRFKNLTEAGKMTEPELLFRFKSVEKIGDKASD